MTTYRGSQVFATLRFQMRRPSTSGVKVEWELHAPHPRVQVTKYERLNAQHDLWSPATKYPVWLVSPCVPSCN